MLCLPKRLDEFAYCAKNYLQFSGKYLHIFKYIYTGEHHSHLEIYVCTVGAVQSVHMALLVPECCVMKLACSILVRFYFTF